MIALATNRLIFIIKAMKNWFLKRNALLTILICLNISILFLYAYIHIVNVDEREHLYASYMIHNGYIPYRDFFEHHHPLLWYIFAPLLYFCDNTPYIWYIIRTFGLIIIFGCTYYVYKLMYIISNNKQSSLIAALFYLSFDITRISGTEFRPDNLMILFFLAGLYTYLKYIKTQQWPFLASSYALLFLSFFTLQKNFFMLITLAAIIIYTAIKNRNLRRQILLTLALPITLTASYILYLYYHNSLKDYFELNWLIYLYRHLDYTFIATKKYIVPLIGAICIFIPNIKKLPYINIIKILYIIEIINLLFTASSEQYFLTLYPFLAIILATTLYQFKQQYQIIVIPIFILTTAVSFYNISHYQKIRLQRAVVYSNLVLSNTKKDDLIVHDLLWIGGLRQSAHGYYWFGLEGIARLDYKIFHRRAFPDINSILKQHHPKLVAHINIYNCLNKQNHITLNCTQEQTIDLNNLVGYMQSELLYLRQY